MTTHAVTSCASCPYSWIGSGDRLWVCTASEPGRTIGFDVAHDARPPEWCPLREADRLVTLRVS